MTIDRRTLALGLSALPLAACATGGGRRSGRPLIIAHRGASGERPEHTADAYMLAISQGADFIEPDLVATKDGVLICRHEHELGDTTDVSQQPRWASRRTTKRMEGREVTGWFAEDFTMAEISELGARERMPEVRPGNDRANGYQLVPTFQDVIDIAKIQAERLGRPVGIYPELKHPSYLKSIGLDTAELLVEALRRNGLPSRQVPVFIQSFEAEPLKGLGAKTGAQIVFLTSDREAVTPARLNELASYAQGLGAEKALLTPELVRNVRAEGLKIHTWTYRAENAYLPADLRRGTDRNAHGDMAGEITRALDMGIDGLFSDYPGLAVQARDAWWAQQNR